MRVISGIFRKIKLKTIKAPFLRPSSAILKEALFNMIGEDIFGTKMLDLFAGTGAVGIEALSRGANFVTFVEKHKPTVKVLYENLSRLQVKKNTQVLCLDAFYALKKLAKEKKMYDFIFIDPPYELYEKNTSFLFSMLSEIEKKRLTVDGGVVFVECPVLKKDKKKRIPLHFLEKKAKKFGRSCLLHYIYDQNL